MALGLRDKTQEPLELRLRRENVVQQMARNGLLVVSDNSDRTYKRILARSMKLLDDARWGELVASFQMRSRRETAETLVAAAKIWCGQMTDLARFWIGGLSIHPALVAGFREVMPDLLSRIDTTMERIEAWEAVIWYDADKKEE